MSCWVKTEMSNRNMRRTWLCSTHSWLHRILVCWLLLRRRVWRVSSTCRPPPWQTSLHVSFCDLRLDSWHFNVTTETGSEKNKRFIHFQQNTRWEITWILFRKKYIHLWRWEIWWWRWAGRGKRPGRNSSTVCGTSLASHLKQLEQQAVIGLLQQTSLQLIQTLSYICKAVSENVSCGSGGENLFLFVCGKVKKATPDQTVCDWLKYWSPLWKAQSQRRDEMSTEKVTDEVYMLLLVH